MIDFSSLILAPAMAVFGQSVTITPVKSRPGAPAYDARGSYGNKPVTIQLEGSEDFHQTNERTLGIRLSEFPMPPRQGDTLRRKAGAPAVAGALPDGVFVVFNVLVDGQGGADLILREIGQP